MVDVTPPGNDSSISEPPSMPSNSGLRAWDSLLPSPPRTPLPEERFNLSSVLQQHASTIDQSMFRLRRLLTTATGLEAFLSAINYALYILAYLETPSPSGSALLQQLFRLGSSRPKLPQDAPSGSSQTSTQPTAPLGTLASLISDTRITLRLTAILPLYTWLRELVADNRRQDQYLRTISYIQCMSYIIYQLTENVAFLTDRGIVSRRWLERTGGSAKWWLWSSRAWLIGVCCDFLRLCREALNERQRRLVARQARKENTEAETSKQQEIDRTWWTNMFIASCWLPLCLHYSLQNGLKGVNNGVIGLLGFMAAAQSFMAQWAKTEAT